MIHKIDGQSILIILQVWISKNLKVSSIIVLRVNSVECLIIINKLVTCIFFKFRKYTLMDFEENQYDVIIVEGLLTLYN